MNIPFQEKINFDCCFHKENKYHCRVLSYYTLRIVNKTYTIEMFWKSLQLLSMT